MKRIIALLMIFISSQVFGQTKEELAKSKDFQQYVISVFQMSLSIGLKFTAEERQALIRDIENWKAEPMTDAQQFDYVTSSFRLRDINVFKSFYDSLNTVRERILKLYGDIPQQIYADAATIIIDGRAPVCANKFRFALCSASIGGQGALMIAACEAGTVVIGTPLCIAAAIAFTANGIAECHDKWCKRSVDL